MDTFYTNEINTQITIGLLKAHGIKKIVASPGATNIRLIASMQQDSYFEMYSVVDERSAAYIACGIATESGEPVVLSCTGATASRNYAPGLTEAFYRKLPILAITSSQHIGRVGQNIAQVLDHSTIMKDIAKMSIRIPTVHVEEDAWACNVNLNKAMLELKHNGIGPVHIDLETTYSNDFSVKELPKARAIYRIGYHDDFPEIEANRKIGIFVGAHVKWTEDLTTAVNNFCENYNAIVLCDQSSNYRGKYRVLFNLITAQSQYKAKCNNFDLIIHIGDISGAYPNFKSKSEWRVNPDGEIRDTFKNLQFVFEMEEMYFFKKYIEKTNGRISNTFAEDWHLEYGNLNGLIPELPFSNIWIASVTANKLPSNTILHLGILNSLRSWNFFETPSSVHCYSNTGGFGIDGILSSAIGASMVNRNKTVFCVLGDLAFFYDINSLGNRHIGNNIRILLINNGKGTEFRNYNHPGAQFGDDSDDFIAAANHFGSKSDKLVKHFAEDLGFEYMSASNKQDFKNMQEHFLSSESTERPMIFEVFTNWEDESNALEIMNNLIMTSSGSAKNVIKNLVGKKNIKAIKKVMGK